MPKVNKKIQRHKAYKKQLNIFKNNNKDGRGNFEFKNPFKGTITKTRAKILEVIDENKAKVSFSLAEESRALDKFKEKEQEQIRANRLRRQQKYAKSN